MNRNKKPFAFIAVIVAAAFALSACGSGSSGGSSSTLTIGTQTYTEPKIIAEMYKALIENRTDMKVDVVPDLAASPIVIQSLKSNDVQMATLYSGEIFNDYFDITDTKDRAEVLKQAQDGFREHYGFEWFDSYGFENKYAFAVSRELAEKHNLTTVSDLADHAGELSLGVDTTWLERENDGYQAFSKHYGFSFGRTFPMEISLVYQALNDKQVDAVLAYTTDPGIKQYDLVTLEDDKQFFPPYDASPVIRQDMLEAHPELEEVIGLLVGRIDAGQMATLNYEVDVEKKEPRDVAAAFLRSEGLLDE